jgi:hypothetical protein
LLNSELFSCTTQWIFITLGKTRSDVLPVIHLRTLCTLYGVRCSVFGIRCSVFSHCHSLLPAEGSLPFYFSADEYNHEFINAYRVESRTFLMFSIIHIKLQTAVLFSNTCPNRHMRGKVKVYPYCGHMSEEDLTFWYGSQSLHIFNSRNVTILNTEVFLGYILALFLCMCIYVCVCVCVYIYIYIHTHTHTHTHTHKYTKAFQNQPPIGW